MLVEIRVMLDIIKKKPTKYKLDLVFSVLEHWNNNPWVDVSLNSETFRANQSLFLLLNAKEAANNNFIVFDLTRSVLEPTIYSNRVKHVNQYTTDAVYLIWTNHIFT